MENVKEILAAHKTWLESADEEGERADLRGADLRGADLQGADLQGADLQGANLQGADLQGANLQGADLQGANLQGADLQGANLQGADLQGADLQGADLRGANIDFSCWPLWCGSLGVSIDEKQARQLFYHAFAAGTKFFPGGLTEKQKAWLQEFEHATDEINSKM
jgi:hypothetical protein